MHINIIHIIIAVAIGVIASFARGKNGKINLKLALALSAIFALVIIVVDWIRL